MSDGVVPTHGLQQLLSSPRFVLFCLSKISTFLFFIMKYSYIFVLYKK